MSVNACIASNGRRAIGLHVSDSSDKDIVFYSFVEADLDPASTQPVKKDAGLQLRTKDDSPLHAHHGMMRTIKRR